MRSLWRGPLIPLLYSLNPWVLLTSKIRDSGHQLNTFSQTPCHFYLFTYIFVFGYWGQTLNLLHVKQGLCNKVQNSPFETGFHYTAMAGLELTTSELPDSWLPLPLPETTPSSAPKHSFPCIYYILLVTRGQNIQAANVHRKYVFRYFKNRRSTALTVGTEDGARAQSMHRHPQEKHMLCLGCLREQKC